MNVNAFTVDVEDWYQTNDFNFPVSRWEQFEDRVEESTLTLLGLLSRYRVRATFFILGAVAQKHPSLIGRIAAEGHEIACHGGYHRLLTEMNAGQFREEIREAKGRIEDAAGMEVRFFRAPSWSIGPANYDMLQILEEEGFTVDSSIQPFRTPLSGVVGAPVKPFYPIIAGKTLRILEFPSTVLKIGGMPLPFSGGLYLRAMPYFVIRWALRQVGRTRAGMVYVHPWEVDQGQPRLRASYLIRFAHYYHLDRTIEKLDRLLQDFRFAPLGEVIRDQSYEAVELI